jgi:hypothetical protein
VGNASRRRAHGSEGNDIAKNITDMGVAVRGAGDKYEVEDNTLAGAFDGLF